MIKIQSEFYFMSIIMLKYDNWLKGRGWFFMASPVVYLMLILTEI